MERSLLWKFAWQWVRSIVAKRNYPASKLSQHLPTIISQLFKTSYDNNFTTTSSSSNFGQTFHNINFDENLLAVKTPLEASSN